MGDVVTVSGEMRLTIAGIRKLLTVGRRVRFMGVVYRDHDSAERVLQGPDYGKVRTVAQHRSKDVVFEREDGSKSYLELVGCYGLVMLKNGDEVNEFHVVFKDSGDRIRYELVE